MRHFERNCPNLRVNDVVYDFAGAMSETCDRPLLEESFSITSPTEKLHSTFLQSLILRIAVKFVRY